MIGLCHFCLISGIEIFVNKRNIRCAKCRTAVKQPERKDEGHLLKFEDAPVPTDKQREETINRIAKESYERLLKRYPET